MPNLYMLIGLPGVGKTQWIRNQNFDPNTTVVISTDDIIDREAAAQGKTYNEVFRATSKKATREMMNNLQDAIAAGKDVVWDQTNWSSKVRKKQLEYFPDDYFRLAVVFDTPDTKEWERRLANRPGKVIPPHVVQSMQQNMEQPDTSEGFDQITRVKG